MAYIIVAQQREFRVSSAWNPPPKQRTTENTEFSLCSQGLGEKETKLNFHQRVHRDGSPYLMLSLLKSMSFSVSYVV